MFSLTMDNVCLYIWVWQKVIRYWSFICHSRSKLCAMVRSINVTTFRGEWKSIFPSYWYFTKSQLVCCNIIKIVCQLLYLFFWNLGQTCPCQTFNHIILMIQLFSKPRKTIRKGANFNIDGTHFFLCSISQYIFWDFQFRALENIFQKYFICGYHFRKL